MTPPSDGDVLRTVVFKGRTTTEAVGATLRCDVDAATTALTALTDAGLIEAVGADRFKPTDAGRAWLADLYAAERAACQQEMASTLDEFHAPNAELKEVVTAWQLRTVAGEQVPNDHTDPRYDGEVLRRLRDDVHGAIVALLDQAGSSLPRLGLYRDRFADALGRIEKGEHTYIAHPILDSYHTIWFELHEELLRLADRDRAIETAAGRA